MIAACLCIVPAVALGEARYGLGTRVEREGVSVRMLAGRPIRERRDGETTILEQGEGSLVLSVKYGGAVVDALGTSGERRAIEVCGRPAMRIDARFDPVPTTRATVADPDGFHCVEEPLVETRKLVHVVLTHRGVPFVVTGDTVFGSSERQRAIIEQRIAEIRCR